MKIEIKWKFEYKINIDRIIFILEYDYYKNYYIYVFIVAL